ncbi:MAG: hypothetical protein ACHRXM_33830 [Isosphaerales bacterium]
MRGDDGQFWPDKHKGFSVRLRELADVAEVMRVIDSLTQDCPALRVIVAEALTVFDNEAFWEALVSIPPHQRAIVLLALRDAAWAIRDAKPCDFCLEAQARHIRFLAIDQAQYAQVITPKPDRGSFLGLAVTCCRCETATDAELGRRLVTDRPDVLRQVAETPYRRHVILGHRIGETESLGHRRVLEECGDCQAMLWVDQDESDRVAPDLPLYLCRPCSLKRAESGTIDCVPMFILGGTL